MVMSGCGSQGTETTAASAGTQAETAAETAEAEKPSETAAEKETVAPSEVVEEGMVPVYAGELKDGTYEIKVDSSSSMFNITDCLLTVEDGAMSAVMTMSGKGYLKVFMGTGEEAETASEADFIPYAEAEDGSHTFEVPVEALDMGIDCAAFSKNKEQWYDRTLVFRADSLPAEAFMEGRIATAESLGLADGTYRIDVALGGGSGRTSVESPALLTVKDGRMTARIVFSSPNYDYMKVDGVQYDRVNEEGNSAFEIPVSGLDFPMAVIADTIAMSVPHEIEYTLTFDSSSLEPEGSLEDAKPFASMELHYADQFSVDYYDGGYKLISIKDGGSYLVVPEGSEPPSGLSEEIVVLRQPLDHVYLVATSAMDFICDIESLDKIALSGTEASGWYIKEAREAMEAGDIAYAGKYSAPDYERILAAGCDLAVESTMIYHSPEVKEQMETLGIPVLVERSSYESHPLGRMEWIRLYGALFNKEELAEEQFFKQETLLKEAMAGESTGKTAAFFYVSSGGYVNVRKSGDYVAKMIGLAGGTYVPETPGGEENALSTMNMEMEAFYAAAREADYILYNSTIDGELETMEQLLEKSSLLSDFKAVKNGNVWCTGKNMFQETMGLGGMILEMHQIFAGEAEDEMEYFHKLK